MAFLFTVIPMIIFSVWLPYWVDMSKIEGKYFAALSDSRWTAITKPVTAGFEELGWGGNATWHFLVYSPTLPVVVAGILVTLALYLARGRFPRLFFRPEGMVLGLISFASPFLDCYIIAYVAKYLTLRIGGVKVYEEKGVPLATGLFVGVGLLTFVTAIGNLLTAFQMI